MRRKSKLTSSMFSSELQTGIAYALLAGVLWGMGRCFKSVGSIGLFTTKARRVSSGALRAPVHLGLSRAKDAKVAK